MVEEAGINGGRLEEVKDDLLSRRYLGDFKRGSILVLNGSILKMLTKTWQPVNQGFLIDFRALGISKED